MVNPGGVFRSLNERFHLDVEFFRVVWRRIKNGRGPLDVGGVVKEKNRLYLENVASHIDAGRSFIIHAGGFLMLTVNDMRDAPSKNYSFKDL